MVRFDKLLAELLQSLKGEGKVLSGPRFIQNVQYVVRIYRIAGRQIDFLSGPPSREPDSESIELAISPPFQAAVNELLTLQMADGRELNFWSMSREYKAYGGLH